MILPVQNDIVLEVENMLVVVEVSNGELARVIMSTKGEMQE